MASPDFYDAGPLKQIAINLFYGWGYNFYRQENQLRADDLLIRSKVGWLLGSARAGIEKAEGAYRREKLPPPSREKPRHDAASLAGAQALERLAHDLGAVVGLLTAQPVPENDRMTQRHRKEAATLTRLAEHDEQLVGRAELLRSLLDQKDGAWLIEHAAEVQQGIQAIGESLRTRQLLLFPAP